ncbi:hypothetical protein C8R44DRAFT_745769 [Mycena epipterygia]|nr:hypothetical protein C8R44DRAFT_745769 [Mycena epipterygia]
MIKRNISHAQKPLISVCTGPSWIAFTQVVCSKFFPLNYRIRAMMPGSSTCQSRRFKDLESITVALSHQGPLSLPPPNPAVLHDILVCALFIVGRSLNEDRDRGPQGMDRWWCTMSKSEKMPYHTIRLAAMFRDILGIACSLPSPTPYSIPPLIYDRIYLKPKARFEYRISDDSLSIILSPNFHTTSDPSRNVSAGAERPSMDILGVTLTPKTGLSASTLNAPPWLGLNYTVSAALVNYCPVENSPTPQSRDHVPGPMCSPWTFVRQIDLVRWTQPNGESRKKIVAGLKSGRNLTRIREQESFAPGSNPCGLGIEGILALQKQMQSLPHVKQYVCKVTSENGEEIVITMLPCLADRIHHVKASFHDNTYARVHGIWKEWEVVIWDHKFDFRIKIGRIYSQHETLAVFTKMWLGLFETIEHITKTEVNFKFIDGEGLQAILVNESKPQANALGAYLVGRNRSHLSGIHERNSKLILLNCLRTCIFHVNRKFSDMAKVVPDAPMIRIIRCPYIKTEEELEDFVRWCKDSEYKVVRDWIADKDSVPWFFPSINRFLSKMSEEEERSPPYKSAYWNESHTVGGHSEFDPKSEAQLRAMEENCVLVNHFNTKPHRDRKNNSRRTSHYRQALERSEARNGLENIDDDIERSTAHTRKLRAKKKKLKATSDVGETDLEPPFFPHESYDDSELFLLPGDITDYLLF